MIMKKFKLPIIFGILGIVLLGLSFISFSGNTADLNIQIEKAEKGH